MLTLGDSLDAVLRSKTTDAVWLLLLYYNDDTVAGNVLRLSDAYRTVAGNSYHGLVRSWGAYHQAANLVRFRASTGTLTVRLDNTRLALGGQRFTDLYASKNFANRKWELYLAADGIVSSDTIGAGRISGELSGDDETVTLQLLNYESRFDLRLPATTVTIGTYPDAPSNNIGKPIPMAYGDFDRSSATGSPMNYDRAMPKGRFPAVIVDRNDIDAAPDAAGNTMAILRDELVYMRLGDYYAACDSANVTTTAATPQIQFSGDSWFIRIGLSGNDGDHTGANVDLLHDNDPATSGVIKSQAAGDTQAYIFDIPAVADVGVFQNIYLAMDKLSVDDGGSPGIPTVKASWKRRGGNSFSSNSNYSFDTTDQRLVLGTSNSNNDLPGAGAQLRLLITGDTIGLNQAAMTLNELVLEVELQPTEDFSQIQWLQDNRLPATVSRSSVGLGAALLGTGGPFTISNTASYNETVIAAPPVDTIYFAGQGRTYGAWIDTINGNPRNSENGGASDPGYNSGDLIENPVYIVEDILRTEAGLDPSTSGAHIDVTSFDTAGASADGQLGDVFADAMADVKFAFSQHKFTDTLTLVEKIGHQCGLLFFLSGSGKIKARARRRPANYVANDQDLTVPYDDIAAVAARLSPIGRVRNAITVRYSLDYARDDTTASASASDSTSQGTTASGYNQTLTLEAVLDTILDTTTASNFAGALLAWHKDRHRIITLRTALPRYQRLEIGDVINFSGWPADLQIFGTTPAATDFFMVTDITKSGPDNTRIECMEVS